MLHISVRRLMASASLVVLTSTFVTAARAIDFVNDTDLANEGISYGGTFTGNVINNASITQADGSDQTAVYFDGNLTGNVTNNGLLSAYSEEDCNLYAIALDVQGYVDGTITNTGTISAETYYADRKGYATAVRIDDTVTGDFINNGGTISATSYESGKGKSVGVKIDDSGYLGGSLINKTDSTISATSTNTSREARATAIEVDNYVSGDISNSGLLSAASSNTDGTRGGESRALGIRVNGGVGGAIVNQEGASITATVSALNGSVFSVGKARGIDVKNGTVGGGISNLGSIEATATYDNSSSSSIDLAYATGIEVRNSLVFGGITNANTITVAAQGWSEGSAVGIHVGDSAYVLSQLYDEDSGAAADIVNSGTITVTGNQNAVGILVDSGGHLGEGYGSINNTGTITALIGSSIISDSMDTMDYAPEYGFAIKISNAGYGIDVNQLGGALNGNIQLDRNNEDALNWSGGTITGDFISGGDLRCGDAGYMNIFAGASNSFSYDGGINNFYAVNIGQSIRLAFLGSASSPVTFTLNGNMRQVGYLDVNDGGTLIVGASGHADVENYWQSAGGTTAFTITGPNNLTRMVPNSSIYYDDTADLSGTVKAIFQPGNYKGTSEYLVIDTDEGELSGDFTKFVSSTALQTITGYQDGGQYYLVATTVSYGGVNGLNQNSQRLGSLLDNLDPDTNAKLQGLLEQLYTLSPDDYVKAMNSISDNTKGDAAFAGADLSANLLGVIQGVLNSNHSGVAINDGGPALVQVADNKVSDTMSDAGSGYSLLPSAVVKSAADAGLRVWTRIFGNWGKQNSQGGMQGYYATGGGIAFGADKLISEGTHVGFAGGYQRAALTFGTQSHTGIDSYSIVAYADRSFDTNYVDAMAGYSWQQYEGNRNYIGGPSTSDFDGNTIVAAVEIGRNYDFGVAKLQPFLGLNYSHSETDSSDEVGGLLPQHLDSTSSNSLRSVIGVRLSKTYDVGQFGPQLTPVLEVGYKRENLDTRPSVGVSLLGIPGSNYTANGIATDRNILSVAAGLTAKLGDNFDVYGEYRGDLSKGSQNNVASVRLRLNF